MTREEKEPAADEAGAPKFDKDETIHRLGSMK